MRSIWSRGGAVGRRSTEGFSGAVVREVRAGIKILDRMISGGNGEQEH